MSAPALSTLYIDEPVLRMGAPAKRSWSAYAGVAIEAAVNLTEDRQYREIRLGERLRKAVGEQRGFLAGLLDPSLEVVYDLRIVRDPELGQLQSAILLRAIAAEEQQARERASDLTGKLLADLPEHVLASAIADPAQLDALRNPFAGELGEAAFVTREELLATPLRSDIRARYAYLYSVAPFQTGMVDWSALYRTLLACPEPALLSIALKPQSTPPELELLLDRYATTYAQWARPERSQGELYGGERSFPAEAFAIDAAAVFADFAQRLSTRCFAVRALLASPTRLPVGLAQSFGATISPLDGPLQDAREGRRAASAYRLRAGAGAAELARWDLQTLDLGVPPGEARIWQQLSPPPAALADLPILGDARDASCAFRLPIALTGDLPGIRVRRGRSGQAEASSAGQRPIRLGRIDGTGGWVSVQAASLSKHALIAGSTGFGKTTIVLELLRQLWPALAAGERRIPFLVIEPVNDTADDYRKLLHLPELAEDLEIYTVGDERIRPLRFNPFAVPVGVLAGEHMSALLAAFKVAFGLWDPLPAIYEEVIAETYALAGILPGDTVTSADQRAWPTVVEFLEAMERATEGLGYSGEVKANLEAASVIRARQLVYGACASTFRTDQALDVQRLLEKPTVIELKTLGSSEEQALVMALLMNAITGYYKANRGAQSDIQHVTVIEEAHRLLARARGEGAMPAQGQAREQAAEAFAAVLAENRKYGEGIVIAEQIPSKLVQDAVKNTNLKIMCRLTAEDERDYLGPSMAMSPEQRLAAARLSAGEALVYADELPNATEVRTVPTLLDAHGQGLEVPQQIPQEHTPPFAFCAVCPDPCRWRSDGLALARNRAIIAATDTWRAAVARPAGERPADSPASASVNGAGEALVATILGEARRYPSVNQPERLLGTATCAMVHTLEGRTKSAQWVSWCAERIATAVESTAVE